MSVKADALAEQLSDLKEVLSELREEINTRFDRVDGSTDKISSFKTAMQFASIIIVPVLLALIGGYFALKGAQVSAISH